VFTWFIRNVEYLFIYIDKQSSSKTRNAPDLVGLAWLGSLRPPIKSNKDRIVSRV